MSTGPGAYLLPLLLKSIAVAVEQQSMTTRDIASNVCQVAMGIKEMTGVVTKAAEVSQTIAVEIATVSHTSDEMEAVNAQLNTNATRLASMGGALKTLIDRFKYA